ncbi:molybdopterin-dependent oxidoreductase [Dactylosporangium matsuzakiense]|nr:molybdopterin-dependent oxidoreductase [Dactylosporangium matsuzakiense]
MASFGDPGSGPAVAVGGVLVDAAPTPVKEFAVRTFGTADKPVLLSGVAVGIAAVAVVVGLLAARRRWFGLAGAALFAVAGAAAAVSRPSAGLLAALPSLAGGVATALALSALNRRRASGTDPATAHPATAHPANAQTANAQTANAQTANAQTANAQSVSAQSTNAQSVSAQSTNAQTASAETPNAQSTNAQTPNAQSANAHPVSERPASESSASRQLGNAQPASDEPTSRGFRGRFAPAPGRGLRAPGTPDVARFDRRAFLQAAAAVSAVTVAAGAGAVVTRRVRGGAASRDRQAVRLPTPAEPAPPLPAGQDPAFVTANRDFYRVDTALTVPRVDLESWRLRVHGRVEHPLTFTFAELLQRPLIERHITLNCVSNEVGGPYIGTAKWLGVPLAPLLREAGIDPGADQVVARSVDGMSIGTPVRTVLDTADVMLCVGMNGEPLPLEHGFPVRMLTPGLYGYAGACKWLTELELTTFGAFDAYWVSRGWAARGPVKTASRIDRPSSFGHVRPGAVPVAGVAWAQGRGIDKVEVQIDDEPWRPADLLPVPSTDTWVQWRLTWTATPGPHTLRVRATDRTGAVQPEQRATPFPDGATGWHTVTVTVDD